MPRSLDEGGDIPQLLVPIMYNVCEVPSLKVSLCHHYCRAVLFDLKSCTRSMRGTSIGRLVNAIL